MWALPVILILVFLTAALSVPGQKISQWDRSTVVTDVRGVPLHGYLSISEEWSLPVPLDEMGMWMPRVAVTLEDRRFFSHPGVDVISLSRAIVQNIRAGEVISGGSTITTQLIRLSVPRKRTLGSKATEFWQAIQLERLMTKSEILELYLNKAPFGSNIRGIEAAARAWFSKPAKELSLSEAAILAGLLRGPAFYRPDRHPERVLALRNRLLDRLGELGIASPDEIRRAKLESVPSKRFAIPSSCREASAHAAAQGASPGLRDRYGRIRSSIDRRMQDIAEQELRLALSGLPREITAAAVIVENETGLVRAYVGNMRGEGDGPASWVDCGSSPRSPGSLLKPFAYALAFESGKLTPSSMLADTPMSMGQTAPRNFDRLFRGPVSARTALADSLNVPAVRVLRSVGPNRLLDLYRRLGLSLITKDAGWYGDSLVLGGCEISLLETAGAYRTLATGGNSGHISWIEEAPSVEKRKVISSGAVALTIDILKDERRLMPLYRELFGEEGTVIAFKTGTSYGLRDAWTAAVTKPYTLVVWFGDPTGKPNEALVGIRTAAPPAVRIMRKITPPGTNWFEYPSEVKNGEVCPLSGSPRNPFCPTGVTDIYIEGLSSREPCRLHVMGNNGPEVSWSPEIELFFSDSESKSAVSMIEITSPRNNASYTMGTRGGKILLNSKGGAGEIYWFVDGELCPPAEGSGEVWWQMSEGMHKVSAADAFGNSAHVWITVRSGSVKETAEELPVLEEVE
ncbi:MAG: penicillin-binding protein 1C [Synergistota bacterium]|nr:penicillin-binding protein 1C [Synergistota bacterium]